MKKFRLIYGTSRFRTMCRNIYFGIDDGLRITSQGDLPVVRIESQKCGDLYRELKLSMTKWAASRQVDLTGSFEGSPSRFEEHYHLAFRRADSTPLPPTTYDRLIEMIERAEVDSKNEIALRGEKNGEEIWISLEDAGREDRRLWTAFHPLWYSVKGFCVFGVVGLMMVAVSVALIRFGQALIGTLIALTAMIMLGWRLMYVRFGFLEWSKRLALSRWQRTGLRLLTGVGVTVISLALMEESFLLPQILRHRTTVLSKPAAYAIPLTGIQIDGNLDDWPAGIKWYPILTNGQPYGSTDVDNVDLATSPDLSPRFMVGYNPTENLLYLAVWVRDDRLVVGGSDDHMHTADACEVYVDGDHSGEKVFRRLWTSASNLAALRYVAIPGEGRYGYEPGWSNPFLAWGEIEKTRTQMAYRRTGDVTVYEWAIQAFDHYPDTPTRLVPEKTIGFDVAVMDKDSEADTPAWICWGPSEWEKSSDSGVLGDLVLVESPVEGR